MHSPFEQRRQSVLYDTHENGYMVKMAPPCLQQRSWSQKHCVQRREQSDTIRVSIFEISGKRAHKVHDATLHIVCRKRSAVKKHPLYKYLSYCANLGLTVVFLELYRELLPDTCDEVIDLDRDTATGTIARRAEAPLQWKFSYSLIDETTAKEAALRLAPIYCEEISVEGSLPRSYSFFDSFGIVSAESLPIRQNWSMADVSKSLAAPIGINSKGELVVLDIHEKAHGAWPDCRYDRIW